MVPAKDTDASESGMNKAGRDRTKVKKPAVMATPVPIKPKVPQSRAITINIGGSQITLPSDMTLTSSSQILIPIQLTSGNSPLVVAANNIPSVSITSQASASVSKNTTVSIAEAKTTLTSASTTMVSNGTCSSASYAEVIPNIEQLRSYVTGADVNIPQLWSLKSEAPDKVLPSASSEFGDQCSDLSQMIAVSAYNSVAEEECSSSCDDEDSAEKELHPGEESEEDSCGAENGDDLNFENSHRFCKRRKISSELATKIARSDVSTILKIMVQQNRLFCCEHCDLYFPTYSTYILHRGCHSSANPWQCHFCEEMMEDKFDFLAHFMHCAHK